MFQTGTAVLVPAKSVSQAALALFVSTAMLVMLANARPYLNWSDNILAQPFQFSLVLVQIVGPLQMNECAAQDDKPHGPILIAFTGVSVGLGVVLILAELFQAVAPKMFEKIATKLRFNSQSISEGLHPKRLSSFRKSIANKMPFTALIVPLHLNDELTDVPRNARPSPNAVAPFVDTSNVFDAGEDLGNKSVVPLRLCFFTLEVTMTPTPKHAFPL